MTGALFELATQRRLKASCLIYVITSWEAIERGAGTT